MSHGGPNRRRRSSDEEDVSSSGPPPPDGGWGWVVAFASFMIHIATDGVTYSFGVFYLQFLNYFDSGKGETAWIVSILVGVTYCSGPIASSFVNKYGCRPVTIAGAILSSACLMVSVFAPNIITLYLTIGVGTGFGFGLIYLPAIVSVTMYFEKYRSLATGIAVCGSGLGTFIFAPLIEWLNDEFGWRGAMLITGALMLHCIIFGALFRPLEYEDEDEDGAIPLDQLNGLEKGMQLQKVTALTDIHVSIHNLKDIQHPPSPLARNGGEKTAMQRPHSMGHFTMPRTSKSVVSGGQNGNAVPNGKLKEAPVDTRLALSTPMLVSDTARFFGSQTIHRKSGPMHRRDVFYQGSLMNIPQYKSRSDLKAHDETHLMSKSDPNSKKSMQMCEFDEDDEDYGSDMLDFSLFADPIFILFTISNFCTSIGFNVPYVYLVAQATNMGISTKDSSYLLSVIGIANTVGRIVLGYLSDKSWVNRLLVYNVCLTLCGIATFLSAFCYDFYSLAAYATVFGFTIGAYVGLTSVILVDLLGLNKLTNAFGLLLLFQGIASFIGPPMAGWLYDATESYDPGFFVAGSAIAASGLMLFCIPQIQVWLDKHKISKEGQVIAQAL